MRQDLSKLKQTYINQQSLVAGIVRKDVDKDAQKAVKAASQKIDQTVDEVRCSIRNYKRTNVALIFNNLICKYCAPQTVSYIFHMIY
jgi:signal transduction histidine kinase